MLISQQAPRLVNMVLATVMEGTPRPANIMLRAVVRANTTTCKYYVSISQETTRLKILMLGGVMEQTPQLEIVMSGGDFSLTLWTPRIKLRKCFHCKLHREKLFIMFP